MRTYMVVGLGFGLALITGSAAFADSADRKHGNQAVKDRHHKHVQENKQHGRPTVHRDHTRDRRPVATRALGTAARRTVIGTASQHAALAAVHRYAAPGTHNQRATSAVVQRRTALATAQQRAAYAALQRHAARYTTTGRAAAHTADQHAAHAAA
ncbi:hypothetical protein FDA94_38820, partial [Herbidospora galbida]